MRIVVVHQYYLTPEDAGISRFNEMARYWSEAGHHVVVIAGTINHHTGATQERYRGRVLTRERDGKVDVWRCYVPAAYRRSYAGRRLGYLVYTLTASLAAAFAPRADIVIATSPPLVTVIPGWLKAKLSGWRTPWIFEVRDLWPESAITTGVVAAGSLQARLFYALEAWSCRTANLVSVLTPAFGEDLLARRLAPPERIVELPNGADLDLFRPAPRDNDFRRRAGFGDRFVALYAGAHGRANALGQLLDAAERLRSRPDILIALAGDGPERGALEADAQRRGLSNVAFLGPIPKERMADCITAADAGIAVLQRNPTFKSVYPNKVFDYMACALPIVLGVDGAARRLVCEEVGAGLFAEPEDGGALATAIARLADGPQLRSTMGTRGRLWVEENASRERIAARYLDVMRQLVERSPGLAAERVRPDA